MLAADPDELAGNPGGEDPYDAAEIAALIGDAVSRLPAGQREATLLLYWQGLTHAEVAAELRISIGAVKNRLHEARAALARPLAIAFDQQEEGSTMSEKAAPEWVEVTVAEIRRGEIEDPLDAPHVIWMHRT